MINSLSIEDKEVFFQLGEIIHSQFSSLYSLDALLESSFDFIYGYYEEGKLVAFVHVNKLYETVDIVNIVVSPLYRRKGIATKLLKYVFTCFSAIDFVLLEVNENNSPAISLYQALGFETISKRKNYYGQDTALVMRKEVKNEGC